MVQANLPSAPQDAVKQLLTALPSRRMRNVIEKRFGLKGNKVFTLDAIGKEYKITRERVRQIEADALRHLEKKAVSAEFTALFDAMERHLKEQGGAAAEQDILASFADGKYKSSVALLLDVAGRFHYMPEDDSFHARWVMNREAAARAEKAVSKLVDTLESHGRPVPRENLLSFAAESAKAVNGGDVPEQVLASYMGISKLIQKNPYGEYGVVTWPAINPRGVRDKAYVVLMKAGKPLHFREVAEGINHAGWTKKKAHPQTVHNELIKDMRFVLVGRGLYALSEWGYEPGAVREVLVSVLRGSGALSREDIMKKVLEKRFVKEATILLNLQNKSLFKRTDDGKYLLV